jgi:hypothetical protein
VQFFTRPQGTVFCTYKLGKKDRVAFRLGH